MCFLGGGQADLSGIKGLFKGIVGNDVGKAVWEQIIWWWEWVMRAHCGVWVSSGKHWFINQTQVSLDYELKEELRAPSLRMAATPLNVYLGPATSHLLYSVLGGSFKEGFLTAYQWWDISGTEGYLTSSQESSLWNSPSTRGCLFGKDLFFLLKSPCPIPFQTLSLGSLRMGSKSEIKT